MFVVAEASEPALRARWQDYTKQWWFQALRGFRARRKKASMHFSLSLGSICVARFSVLITSLCSLMVSQSSLRRHSRRKSLKQMVRIFRLFQSNRKQQDFNKKVASRIRRHLEACVSATTKWWCDHRENWKADNDQTMEWSPDHGQTMTTWRLEWLGRVFKQLRPLSKLQSSMTQMIGWAASWQGWLRRALQNFDNNV